MTTVREALASVGGVEAQEERRNMGRWIELDVVVPGAAIGGVKVQ